MSRSGRGAWRSGTRSEPRRVPEGSPSPSAGPSPRHALLNKWVHQGVVQLQEQLGDQLFIRLPAAESAKAVRGPLRGIRLLPSLRVDLKRHILRNHPKIPHTEIMNPPGNVLHSEADLLRQNLSTVFIHEDLAILNRNHFRPLGRLFLAAVFQRTQNEHTAVDTAAPGHRNPGAHRPDLNQDIRPSPTAFTLHQITSSSSSGTDRNTAIFRHRPNLINCSPPKLSTIYVYKLSPKLSPGLSPKLSPC